MSNNKTFLIVKKYIDKMDYFSLLDSGAPNDEFDYESKIISSRINFKDSAEEIANIIANVFNSRFNENDDPSVFLSVANQIKNELNL